MKVPTILKGEIFGLPKTVVFGGGVAAVGIAIWYRRQHAGTPAVDGNVGQDGTPATDQYPGNDYISGGGGGGGSGGPVQVFPPTWEPGPGTPGTEQIFSYTPGAKGRRDPWILRTLKDLGLANAAPGSLQQAFFHYAMRLYSTDPRNRDLNSYLEGYNLAYGTNYTIAQLKAMFPWAFPGTTPSVPVMTASKVGSKPTPKKVTSHVAPAPNMKQTVRPVTQKKPSMTK